MRGCARPRDGSETPCCQLYVGIRTATSTVCQSIPFNNLFQSLISSSDAVVLLLRSELDAIEKELRGCKQTISSIAEGIHHPNRQSRPLGVIPGKHRSNNRLAASASSARRLAAAASLRRLAAAASSSRRLAAAASSARRRLAVVACSSLLLLLLLLLRRRSQACFPFFLWDNGGE